MAASSNNSSGRPPRVCLIGDHEHPDFADAVALIQGDADLMFDISPRKCAELIILARSRPGMIGRHRVDQLRRTAPLSGIVALLGSWCEGQARASRPTHDAQRLYWYQFAPWWRRQLALRVAGHCPDWARPDAVGGHLQPQRAQYSVLNTQYAAPSGVIMLKTPHWDTAGALADVLRSSGLATVWELPTRTPSVIRGITAGIWDGGQLDDCELECLTEFCRRLARDNAPVIALLDFPRRDRCELTRQAGAALVLGKPWLNCDLLESLKSTRLKFASIGAA
jgi:hypothetical protein